jgi:hypothetical protein
MTITTELLLTAKEIDLLHRCIGNSAAIKPLRPERDDPSLMYVEIQIYDLQELIESICMAGTGGRPNSGLDSLMSAYDSLM